MEDAAGDGHRLEAGFQSGPVGGARSCDSDAKIVRASERILGKPHSPHGGQGLGFAKTH